MAKLTYQEQLRQHQRLKEMSPEFYKVFAEKMKAKLNKQLDTLREQYKNAPEDEKDKIVEEANILKKDLLLYQ